MIDPEVEKINRIRSDIKIVIVVTFVIVVLLVSDLVKPSLFNTIGDGLVYQGKIYSPGKWDGWKTIDLDLFKIDVPENFYYKPLRGMDSYVGQITDKKDHFIFDYGCCSGGFSNERISSSLFSEDTINGFSASLIKPKSKGYGIIGVYFSDLGNNNKFILVGDSIQMSEELVLRMIHSIRFTRSDTTKNTYHEFYERNTPFADHKYISQYCLSCHSYSRKVVGPALCNVSEQQFQDYFLTKDFYKAANDSFPGTDFKWHRKAFHLTESDIKTLVAAVTKRCGPVP